MADMEKVIKALHCCAHTDGSDCMYCPYDHSDEDCTALMSMDVLELLKEQETVVPLTIDDAVSEIMDKHYKRLKEQEWISVKDRLPNCNGCYLVWRPRFYTEKGMPSICYFDGQNAWHDSYGVDFTRVLAPEDVSHWMPLPEQPKER